MTLEKWGDPTWAAVASKGSTLVESGPPQIWEVVINSPGVKELFGSWAPVPAVPDGGGEVVAQTKLWIWSKTPFDYTRHSGAAWDEWFTDRFTEYPCVPIPPDREICCDFEKIEPDQEITSPWQCPEYRDLTLSWLAPSVQTVTVLDTPVDGITHSLCFPRLLPGEHTINEITIDLSEPAKSVEIILTEESGAQASGFDTQGNTYGPFLEERPDNPHLEVRGENLIRVVVRVRGSTCIVKICVVIGLTADEVTQREEMEQHLRDEMARWAQEGDVLEPHTTYRLKVVTTVMSEGEDELADSSEDLEQIEYAYFRTEGPPGPPGLTNLSIPIGYPNREEFDSGLTDLSRYVRQTIPATVPEVGDKPVLPRPVYCAYDIGVEFNENYVDLMYRLERRDLGLYLYDNNNEPVRDAQGRLIVLSNRWGVTEEITLTESDIRWITVVNASDCATLDPTIIPHTKTLTSIAEGQVLDPDTVYEARLVPLLLHDDFSADLTTWEQVDEGTNEGPGRWKLAGHKKLVGEAATAVGPIVNLDGSPDLTALDPKFDVVILHGDTARASRQYRIVSIDDVAKAITVDGEPDLNGAGSAWEIPGVSGLVQTSNIWGGKLNRNDPIKPGTMLIGGHSDWSDYRLSVFLRSTDDDAIGVVFRYLNPEHCYRFSMDREGRKRWLVRVAMGGHSILAEDDFVYRLDQDYLITIEAIGASLRVYQDRALVFEVTDESIDQGRIGLYCWGNAGARFSDVQVDDFSSQAPVVYRFQFTTSCFANFFHHLHSFEDETWRVELDEEPSDEEISALVEQAVASATPPSQDEARTYESLAAHVLGQAARQNPPEVQVTRVERASEALAFLIQSPEPIDWKRTELQVLRAERQFPHSEVPDAVKLTDVSFGTIQPNEESLTLVLRKPLETTGHIIEYRRFPGLLADPADDPVLFVDEFDSGESGLLFREEFGPNALDHYTIVDEGRNFGPSAWALSDGHIVQTSRVYGGSLTGTGPAKPGTMALTGSSSWANMRITTILRSEDDRAIGAVFRYENEDNYYRFSMNREHSNRRLISKVGGNTRVLWEDNVAYNQGRSYSLRVEAYGNDLLGYLDEALLFSVKDAAIGAGRAGFYCWANPGAHFEGLSVESLESPPVLWQPAFADLNEVEVVDEPDAIDGPSQWTVEDGVLIQSSNIHVADGSPHHRGTYALGGEEKWRDMQVSAQLRSDDDGAIGVMFRVLSVSGPGGEELGHSYYCFSMDRQASSRQLIKKVGETVTVLWHDTEQYTIGETYHLTFRASGSELWGYLDGILLFAVTDTDLKHGRIGFYCSANAGARFSNVVVSDRTKKVRRWTVHDDGTVNAPSVWSQKRGTLAQDSNIYDGSSSASDVAKLGTYAVAGDSPGSTTG